MGVLSLPIFKGYQFFRRPLTIGICFILSEVLYALYHHYTRKISVTIKIKNAGEKCKLSQGTELEVTKPKRLPERIRWYRDRDRTDVSWKDLPEDELWNTALFFPEIFPDHAGSQTSRLIWYMEQAKESIKVAIYMANFRLLEDVLFRMVKRKVRVVAVTNVARVVTFWGRRGIQVREKPKVWLSPFSPPSNPVLVDHMHNKFIIIDDKAVITGSLNWTKSAVMENRENVVITNDTRIVPKYVEEFDNLWHISEPTKEPRKVIVKDIYKKFYFY